MKNKKLVLLIIAVILVLISVVSCQYATTAFLITPDKQTGQIEQPAPTETPAVDVDKPAEAPAPDVQTDDSTVYISTGKLNVRETASRDAKIVDSLMKGSAVTIAEEKTDENNVLWYNISYENPSGVVNGWISAEFTVKDRKELLGEGFKNLDLSPQTKTAEYPNNPRVPVKGIYLTLYSASGARLDKLIEMTKRTEINTFVIDVKDDNGHMLFATEAAEKYSPDANKKAPVKDIKALMQKL